MRPLFFRERLPNANLHHNTKGPRKTDGGLGLSSSQLNRNNTTCQAIHLPQPLLADDDITDFAGVKSNTYFLCKIDRGHVVVGQQNYLITFQQIKSTPENNSREGFLAK